MRREQVEAIGAGLFLLALLAFFAVGALLTTQDVIRWLS